MNNNGYGPAPVQGAPTTAAPINPGAPQKKNHTVLIIVLVCVFIFVVLPIVGVIIMFALAGKFMNEIVDDMDASTMICTTPSSSITIRYTEDEIVGYSSFGGISYNLDYEKAQASRLGVKNYLQSYANDFVAGHKNSTCTLDGNVYSSDDSSNSSSYNNNNNNSSIVDTTTVGDTKYGYVDIPKDWTRFTDPDATSTLQYSSGFTNILTMMYYDGPNFANATAKDLATSVYDHLGEDGTVGKTSMIAKTIGKDNSGGYYITAEYPSENLLLEIYICKGKDGMLRYISIEGTPDEVKDSRSILDTLRLTK